MPKYLLFSFVSFFLLTSFTASLFAQQDAVKSKNLEIVGKGKRRALLVGVNQYEALKDLNYCEADATALRDALLKLGFEPGDITLLTSGGEKRPTRLNIEEQLETLFDGLEADDMVLISLSGHGGQFEFRSGNSGKRESFFCPEDARTHRPERTMVSTREIYDMLDRCPARFKMLLIDACRDEHFVEEGIKTAIDESRSMNDFTKSIADGKLPKSTVAMISCVGGQQSYESPKLQQGIFMYHVVQGSLGKADGNGDGLVSLFELRDYVTQQTRDFVYRELKKSQTPRFHAEWETQDFGLFDIGKLAKAKKDWELAIEAMDIPEPYAKGTGPKPNTTLSEAIRSNSREQVRRHISHGTPLDEPGEDGTVPIFLTLDNDNPKPEIFVMLVRAGAKIDTVGEGYGGKGSKGRLLLNDVIWHKKWNTVFVPYLIKLDICVNKRNEYDNDNGKGMTPLAQAVEVGDEQIFQMLLAAGAVLDVREVFDVSSKTLLHCAAKGGSASLCRRLIDEGAKVEAQDSDGQTPLHRAIWADNAENIIKVLIDVGANKEAQDKGGRTPLHEAAFSGKAEPIKALIAAGANEKAKDKDGKTPLHLAAHAGKVEVTKALIDAGANKEAQDKGGQTPLHLAAHAGKVEVIKALIATGAKIEARVPSDLSWGGYTPLHFAAEYGGIDATKALIDGRANVNATIPSGWREGQTPLDLAETEEVKTYLRSKGGRSGKK